MTGGALALASSISEMFACLVPQRVFVLPTEAVAVFTKGKEVSILRDTAFWYWPLRTYVLNFDVADKPYFTGSQKITTTDRQTVNVETQVITCVIDPERLALRSNEEEQEDLVRSMTSTAISQWFSGKTLETILADFHNRDGSLIEMANELLEYYGIKATQITIVELAVSEIVLTHFGIKETE